jgi:ATP-dependent Clp protease ATP-binding subunit ClpC
MNETPKIEFKQNAAQFLKKWKNDQSFRVLGKVVSWGIIALLLVVFVLATMQGVSENHLPIASLFYLNPMVRIFWLNVLGGIVSLYILDEIKRREAYTSSDDVFSFADAYSKNFIAQVLEISKKNKQQLNARLMLRMMLLSSYMQMIFNRMEVSAASVEKTIDSALLPINEPLTGHEVEIDANLQEFILISANRARDRGDDSFGLADVLLTLLEKDVEIAKFFDPLDINPERLTVVLGWVSTKNQLLHNYQALKTRRMHTGPVNQAWTSSPTPILNHYGRDLTVMASYGNVPLVNVRKPEVQTAIEILSRTTKNSLLLAGDPGSGRGAIVAQIALKMLSQDVPKELQDKRLVQLDVASLHGAAEGFEVTFGQLLDETERSGNVILFIPNLQDLATDKTSGVASAELLLPILQRSRMQVIGATTMQEYREQIEPNQTFANSFGIIEVKEMSQKDALTVLEETSVDLEGRHGVKISVKAMEDAVALSSEYIHDKVLPEKAIDILDEAAVKASNAKRKEVTDADVREVVSRVANVPVAAVAQNEQKVLLDLEKLIKERVVGQNEAVVAVAQALRRARAGLTDKKRPIGTFLFVGPTGVGKTELAKALSSSYFSGESNMVRLDMSEFQGGGSIQRLIGEGSTEGLLTGPVRNKPFALLLLDEFEKSSDEIRNLFLSIFDDGRITDGAGHVVDFTNTIMIATSNAGSLEIQDAIKGGQTYEQIQTFLTSDLLPKIFRPELLNRFDGVIAFKPLTQDEVLQIARLQITGVIKQTEESTGIHLTVTEAAIEKLAQLGFDPTLGGRPLRRAIQDHLEAPLANKILAGGLKRGDTLALDVGDLI